MANTELKGAMRCLDCGKCTSACPVARFNLVLSPRRLIRQLGCGVDAGCGDALWSCLTCGRCDAVCPQEVPITAAMPLLRADVRAEGGKPPFTRCGAMESVATIQSQGPVPQNRLEWLTDDLRTDPESKTLLFIGCTPYFDKFFVEHDVDTLAAVKGAIRILNAMGIEPAVLADERCCGHDALWSGDEKTFSDLAHLNLEMFAKAAPDLIVTVCPECSLTLGRTYPERFEAPGCPVKHITEVVSEHYEELEFTARELTVTFQDPCRLGRHQDLYVEPREGLEMIPDLELREMPRNRAAAVCCAGSWLTCNQASKKIQSDRLAEAEATGAELMVTACPKCLIHFRCSQSGVGEEPGIEIRDFADLLAESLQ
ncbi:MAG: (Fe-S)-binding protein [bacterium]|nr:(Fe-S)-binding protein [bacterium]